MSSGRCEMLNSNFTRPLLQTPIHGVKAQEKKFKPWEKWVYQLRKRILVTLSANTSSKIGSKQRECLMRPVPVVSARGRKPWLAAHWSIVWVCIGSDFPGHEIRSWFILKMSCYFKLFFNFMFDMSSHIYLGKLCFIRTPTVQPSPHSWCWGGVLAESRHCCGDICTARHCSQVPTQLCLDFGKRNAYTWLWVRVFSFKINFTNQK